MVGTLFSYITLCSSIRYLFGHVIWIIDVIDIRSRCREEYLHLSQVQVQVNQLFVDHFALLFYRMRKSPTRDSLHVLTRMHRNLIDKQTNHKLTQQEHQKSPCQTYACFNYAFAIPHHQIQPRLINSRRTKSPPKHEAESGPPPPHSSSSRLVPIQSNPYL